MKLKHKYLALIPAILLMYSSCNFSPKATIAENETPIVSFGDKVLYKSVLDKIIPFGTSPEDSIMIVDNYINSWLKDQLLYDKAVKNVSESDDIKKLVFEYQKSLLINEYQNQLLQEKLSDNPLDEDIREFYNTNSVLFLLNDAIIKGIYLKIPKESSEIDNFKKWYKLKTSDAIEKIEEKKLQNTIAYENFYDDWVNFHAILSNIPFVVNDHEEFLKKNKTIEVADSSFVYLLNISEYMIPGELAPFEYVQNKAKVAFIEKQRESFIKELNEDLYNDAINKEQIIFYNKK